MAEEEQVKSSVVGRRAAADKYRSILNDEEAAANTRWRHGGPPVFDAVNKLFDEGRTNKIKKTQSSPTQLDMTSRKDEGAGDKYRLVLNHQDVGEMQWRHREPPTYDVVNRLFEEGRTEVWPEGSLEETVQNAIKSWEMELSHKIRLQDFKTINPDKFKLFVNGREGLSAEETLRLGSYNALLKSSLPKELQYYKADEESFESSHDAFKSAFPRGFAWEILAVYSGPPVIAFKFRHWGYFEGPFMGHAPTGEMAEFIGLGVLKVDESLRAEEIEIYYDPGELFGGLLKGPPISDIKATDSADNSGKQSCPFTH